MKLKYIPNILSLLRIVMVVAFVFVFFYDYPDNCILSAVIYMTACLTDVADGYLARKYGWTTRLGRVLDPMADKLFQMTLLVCFGIKQLLSFWIILPFILKELTQLYLGFLMIKRRNVVVKSKWYGKAVMFLMCFAAAAALICTGYGLQIRLYVNISYAVLLILALVAMLLYIKNNIGIKTEQDNK